MTSSQKPESVPTVDLLKLNKTPTLLILSYSANKKNEVFNLSKYTVNHNSLQQLRKIIAKIITTQDNLIVRPKKDIVTSLAKLHIKRDL